MTIPPLSEEETQLWHAFKRLGEAVMPDVGRDLVAAAAITGSEYGVLSRLVDLGDGSLPQQDLLASLRWEKSRLSHQLTRMAKRGLVERRTVEGQIRVRITAEGRGVLDTARPVHAAAVRRHLVDRLGPEERTGLIAAARALG